MGREPLPPAQWERVKSLFNKVIECPSSARLALLEEVTDDEVVRNEVIALVEQFASLDTFLELQDEPPRLEKGQWLGRYQIEKHLATGGMGSIYRATDTQLDRTVAIKVLASRPNSLANEQFEREAQTIAALSHPNILAVFDVGAEGSVRYFVTELLEGETLRARLSRRRPSLVEALDWATQLADGLAAAHDQNIIHRDLKPENIYVLPDGVIKILDFGLAVRRRELPEADASERAAIVGTAAYMAPEQIRGDTVSTSTDLFALGAIFYEMLTGERAFRANSTVEILARVLESTPPAPSTLCSSVPSWLDALAARAMAKSASERFESARDFAFALRVGQLAGDRIDQKGWRWSVVIGSVIIAASLALGVGWWLSPFNNGGPTASIGIEPMRTRALTNSGRDVAPSVSKDGSFLTFGSERDGRSRIWVQQLTTGRERPLTDGPDRSPRFSPDGTQILFIRYSAATTSVYVVDLLGGQPRKVIDNASEADWSPNGRRITYVRWIEGGAQARPELRVVDIDGSKDQLLASLENRITVRPRWSPDGRWIAVTGVVAQPGSAQSIVLVAADGTNMRHVSPAQRVGLVSAVAWEDEHTLLYSQAASVLGNSAGGSARIVRHDIDADKWSTWMWTREVSSVVERWPGRGVVYDAQSSVQNLRAVSMVDGSERYRSRGIATDRQPVYSPDGRRIAFSSSRTGNLDIWLLDRDSGETTRLTYHDADDWDPAFTPDGQGLLWSSNRSGHFEVWTAKLDGSSIRQVTADGSDAENPTPTPDGEWVVYGSGARHRRGVWKVRVDGTDATHLVPDVLLPEVSPDGQYVLYQGNRHTDQAFVGVARVDTGEVLPFEIEIEIRKLSRSVRAGRARWTPDGQAIVFVAPDEDEQFGVYWQAFSPTEDTRASRRPLAGFRKEQTTESFDVTNDEIILAEYEQRATILVSYRARR